MTTWYSCESDLLPFCCGFFEAGDFCRMSSPDKPRSLQWASETPEELLTKVLNHAEGRPVIFNFVKPAIGYDDDEGPTGEFEPDYLCDELRQVVKAHKNVIDIGSHINPGTHNKIHSYIITDYQ